MICLVAWVICNHSSPKPNESGYYGNMYVHYHDSNIVILMQPFSFVRSTTMDKWKESELAKMKVTSLPYHPPTLPPSPPLSLTLSTPFLLISKRLEVTGKPKNFLIIILIYVLVWVFRRNTTLKQLLFIETRYHFLLAHTITNEKL